VWLCIAVFGEGFKGFNIVHLVTGDVIVVELFDMVGQMQFDAQSYSC